MNTSYADSLYEGRHLVLLAMSAWCRGKQPPQHPFTLPPPHRQEVSSLWSRDIALVAINRPPYRPTSAGQWEAEKQTGLPFSRADDQRNTKPLQQQSRSGYSYRQEVSCGWN